MKNWMLVLLALSVTFLGIVTKKLFFLLFIIPLTLFWDKTKDE
tara:strand:+ start:328 stop:456 length:129 start_codon:yes stop_codon:yes gene_type:complete